MFKRMNKFVAFIVLLVLATTVINCVSGEEIAPYADSVFNSASISLKTSRRATYIATTNGTQGSISITACWLQKEDENGWDYVCALSRPSSASNTYLYSREMDYYSSIGSGTYRIGATFNADGHAITRYSNSRTFP